MLYTRLENYLGENETLTKNKKNMEKDYLKIKHEYGISGSLAITTIILVFVIGKVVTDLYQMKLEFKKGEKV